MVEELGFDGIKLILESTGNLDTCWSQKRIDDLNRLCKSYNLEVSEFALFQDMVGGLADLNPLEKERALEHFESGCKMTVAFGSEIVNIAPPWPAGMTSSHFYLPMFIRINAPGVENYEPKFKMRLQEDFNWDAH